VIPLFLIQNFFRMSKRALTCMVLQRSQARTRRAVRYFTVSPKMLEKKGMQLDDLLVDGKTIGEDFDKMSNETKPGAFVKKVDRNGNPLPGEIEPSELLDPTYRVKGGLLSTIGDWAASEAVRWTGKESNGFATQEFMKKLGAFKAKDVTFQYRPIGLDKAQMETIRNKLKIEAEEKLKAISVNGRPEIHIFLTGASGFIGQDFCQRVSTDADVKSVTCVILKEEMGKMNVEQWTKKYCERLDLPEQSYSKYRFIVGDVEKPSLGMPESEIEAMKTKITHFYHLAASVSFEDPYNYMYSKNVQATQYALEVASKIQNAPGSKLVNAIFTETCYIHGRRRNMKSKEAELIFPNDYYNNYYELTKALGDVVAMEACYQKGLRVIGCCPAIVIGNSWDGNNHGDRKVVNAAGNAFGRIHEELQKIPQPMRWIALKNIMAFPGSGNVTMNVSPVNRIVDGLHAALRKPGATGERIHLGCGGLNTGRLTEIYKEEIGIHIAYVNPVIHRVVRRPILGAMFKLIGLGKLYKRLEVLFNIFGGYCEWGQPDHELGNDVRLLGLTEKRPNVEQVLRLMCRHNMHVQQWGQIRDRDEIARREKIWKKFCAEYVKKAGKEMNDIPPAEFHKAVKEAKLW
jgi:nucleoside-diphosphate-sugar epimerase